MPTKLSRYCEGIIEAGWLIAVILVPFFFNIYSSRIFEPDKLTMLRSIALLILAAWLVKILDEGGVRWDRIRPATLNLKSILRLPLLLPVAALVTIYLISTIFSVTLRVSLVGSYQRLQGMYTTYSYIVVFFAIIINLRKRSQLDRLVTVIILTGLPISLYGVLQRYKIDPVPWGGDVSNRIASNMGNSIFVAAYLILVFPLIIGRIIDSFKAIMTEKTGISGHVARATIYVFTAAIVLIAIYLSGSRGPWLGWMSGSFFLFMLLSLLWNKRWLTISIVVVALILGAFIVVLNIPKGPLESLRSLPGVGRLGQIFSAESRTGQVRTLIWQGAAELVMPHRPLEYPDGRKDVFNFLRPLIGYGPESMYVAYNPFYQTGLGHVEKRNASPDRSHNETWDSLVFTGLIGLVVYFTLFGAVFYYALKWIGLITDKKQRNLFLGFYLVGGLLGAVGMVMWGGIKYFGVGLPFGIILGLLGYLAVRSFFGTYEPPKEPNEISRMLLLIVLLASIMSHFVEINFGIAIASTRTYFWVMTGMLFVAGYVLPKLSDVRGPAGAGEALNRSAPDYPKTKEKSLKRRRRLEQSMRQKVNYRTWLATALAGGGILSYYTMTFGYNFISNPLHDKTVLKVIWNSLTRLPNRNNAVSYGILAMILTTWLAGGILWVVEHVQAKGGDKQKALLMVLGISLFTGFFFWLWHSGTLVVLATTTPSVDTQVIEQINRVGGLLTTFYGFGFLLLLFSAFYLPDEWPQRTSSMSVNYAIAGVLLLVVFLVISLTNLRVIRADIAFKMAEPFNRAGQWHIANFIYNYARDLAPSEDHYYLFLGRSYLETAKETKEVSSQDELVRQSEADLKVAQKINPLNTDHTANLARLYSWWASRATDLETRRSRAEMASNYYERALVLSPNNSTIWGEWAVLYMDVFRQPERAYELLSHALELDAEYNWTQGLMGDYYIRTGRAITEPVTKSEVIVQALEHYNLALKYTNVNENTARLTYLYAIGNSYIELGNLDGALNTYIQAEQIGQQSTDIWKIEEQIARLYYLGGDKENALLHADLALSKAPQDQQERLKDFKSQLLTLP